MLITLVVSCDIIYILIPVKNIYVGCDESYDVDSENNFVMVFTIFEDILNIEDLSFKMNKIATEKEIKEIKYDKSNDKLKVKIFNMTKKNNIKLIVSKSKIFNKNKVIPTEDCLKDLSFKLKKEYKNSNFFIKIDQVFGVKWQSKIKKEIHFILKTKKVNKVEIQFVNSIKSSLVQVADFYAGLNRRRDSGKDKMFWKYLNAEI